MATKRFKAGELKNCEDRTDYARLETMSEAELEEAAGADPDSTPPTDEQLAAFKRAAPDDRSEGPGASDT